MAKFGGLILVILFVIGAIYAATHWAPQLVKVNLQSNSSRTKNIQQNIVNNQSQSDQTFNTSAASNQQTTQNKKKVKISWVRQPSDFFNKAYTEVVLYTNLEQKETVNVTGWKIKSNKNEFLIPQAQKIYSSNGVQEDIVLNYNDRLHLFSGGYYLGGFRLNKCTGYLEDGSTYNPPLPKNCPWISRDELSSFSGACQSYILSLSSCQIASKNPQNQNPQVPYSDQGCYDFMDKLNYVGCVEKHRNDSDFLSTEWYVWMMDKVNIFDSLHDKVQLFDSEGNLVDEYTY